MVLRTLPLKNRPKTLEHIGSRTHVPTHVGWFLALRSLHFVKNLRFLQNLESDKWNVYKIGLVEACFPIFSPFYYFKNPGFQALRMPTNYYSDIGAAFMLAQAPTQTLRSLKQTLFFSSHLKFKFKKLEIHEVCPPPHELRTLFLFFFLLQVEYYYQSWAQWSNKSITMHIGVYFSSQ